MNFYFEILIFFLIAIFGNTLIIATGKHLINKKLQIQNIHTGTTPPLGGILIFTLFLFYYYFFDNFFFNNFFILYSFFIIIPAIFEDLGIEIKPKLRLLFILVGSFCLILNLNYLPEFNFYILNIVFNNGYFQIILFTFALATVINGQNIIDGTNGLSASSSFITFACIGYLGLHTNNYELLRLSILMCTLLIAFLIFNYPFGKIFMGDCGSYFLGLLSGYTVIYTFAKYQELPTWSAVIILFYPSLEVIFSYVRKLKSGYSPFEADLQHLHLKLFFLISKNSKKKLLCNSLVAPFLGIIWIAPLALLPISLVLPHLAILIIVFLFIIYLVLYFAIPKVD